MIRRLSNTRYKQVVVSIGGMLTQASGNALGSWTSPALPHLTSDHSPLGEPLTTIQSTLVVAILFVGMTIGSLATSWLIDHYGRKICLLTSAVSGLMACIMIYFGRSVAVLYAARIIAGIGLGFSVTAAPVYNSEIADNDIRGSISMLYVILSTVGSVFMYAVGPFVSYRTLPALTAILPTSALITCFMIPESPYYLVKNNKIEKTRSVLKSLAKSTATQEYIETRILEIKNFIESEVKNRISFKQLFFDKEHRKPLLIVFGLKTLVYLVGDIPISAYMQTIINSSGSSISSETASLIFGVTQMVFCIPAGRIYDKIGRKPVLAVSSIGCFTALFSEGIYFYLQERTTLNLQAISWIPVTAVVLFEICIIVGPGAVPFVIMGEVFTMNAKGKAVSAVAFYSAGLGILMTMTFEPMNEAFGIYTTFWIYACFGLLEVFFAIFVLPETKGKSFAEIQHKLNKNSNK